MAITFVVVNVRETIPPQAKSHLPPNAKPGFQVFFTEDVVLKQYEAQTPGNGLPQNEANRYVGIHSGILTLLRVTGDGDRFYAPATRICQYSATHRFRNLPNTPGTTDVWTKYPEVDHRARAVRHIGL